MQSTETLISRNSLTCLFSRSELLKFRQFGQFVTAQGEGHKDGLAIAKNRKEINYEI